MRLASRVLGLCAALGLAACGSKGTTAGGAESGGPPRLGEPVVLGGRVGRRPVEVRVVAASADGSIVFAVDDRMRDPITPDSSQPGVSVWRRPDWTPQKRLGEADVHALAVTPDGKLLASGDDDGKVRVWDVAGGTLRGEFPLGERAVAVWIAPDGGKVIAVGREGAGALFDVASGKSVETWKEGGVVVAAAIAPSGEVVAIGREDGVTSVRAPGDGAARRLEATAPAAAIAFTADGSHVAVGDHGGAVTIYAVRNGEVVQQESVSSGWPIRGVAMPAADQVVAVTNDYMVRLSWKDGVRDSQRFGEGVSVRSLAPFDGGQKLVTGTFEGAVRVFDVAALRELREDSHTDRVKTLHFTADGSILSRGPFVGEPWMKTGRRWDVKARKSTALPGDAGLLTVSPSGLLMARATFAEMDASEQWADLVISDSTPVAAERKRVKLTTPPMTARAFAAKDGALLMLEGTQAGVLDVATGKLGPAFSISADAEDVVQAAGISADGARVAIGVGAGKITLWDATTGKLAVTLEPTFLNVNFLFFTPDGAKLVASTQSHGVQVWNVATGALVRTIFEGDGNRPQATADGAYSGDLSNDGRVLATGHGSGIIRLWNVETGAELASADPGTGSFVSAVDIAPDGKQVATADEDGVIWVRPM